MNTIYSFTIVVSLVLVRVRCNLGFLSHVGHIHPTQGLFVKPSVDGSSDLFVAATGDSGVQWLSEKPVNYMPAGLPYFSPIVPQDEAFSATQKRSVVAPPPVTYAYAMPTGSETFPAPATTENKCSETPAMPYPYHFFYPHLMSAIAGAMNIAKDGSAAEESTAAAPAPVWPQNYGYPFQYVMVDPSSWPQAQTTTTATTAPPASTSTNEKTT